VAIESNRGPFSTICDATVDGSMDYDTTIRRGPCLVSSFAASLCSHRASTTGKRPQPKTSRSRKDSYSSRKVLIRASGPTCWITKSSTFKVRDRWYQLVPDFHNDRASGAHAFALCVLRFLELEHIVIQTNAESVGPAEWGFFAPGQP